MSARAYYAGLSDAHFGEAIRMCGNDSNGFLTWHSLLKWNILLGS